MALPIDEVPNSLPEIRPVITAIGADSGGPAVVTVFNGDGTERLRLDAFPNFTGGARVAVGDANGDGFPDIVIGAGPGGSPMIRVLDGRDGAELHSFLAFEESFHGGVYVAVGDINEDGTADLIISPDEGGGPRVRILDGRNPGATLADFFGIEDPNFRGGARVAVGDLNGDGASDLIVAAGFGGGPRVAAFNGTTLRAGQRVKLFNDFYVFEETLRNGAYIAAGDLNRDGFSDLIAGGGPGGGPRILAYSGKYLANHGDFELTVYLANFFAGDPSSQDGVRVASGDWNGDGFADILAGSASGSQESLVYAGREADIFNEYTLDTGSFSYHDGTYVAVSPGWLDMDLISLPEEDNNPPLAEESTPPIVIEETDSPPPPANTPPRIVSSMYYPDLIEGQAYRLEFTVADEETPSELIRAEIVPDDPTFFSNPDITQTGSQWIVTATALKTGSTTVRIRLMDSQGMTSGEYSTPVSIAPDPIKPADFYNMHIVDLIKKTYRGTFTENIFVRQDIGKKKYTVPVEIELIIEDVIVSNPNNNPKETDRGRYDFTGKISIRPAGFPSIDMLPISGTYMLTQFPEEGTLDPQIGTMTFRSAGTYNYQNTFVYVSGSPNMTNGVWGETTNLIFNLANTYENGTSNYSPVTLRRTN